MTAIIWRGGAPSLTVTAFHGGQVRGRCLSIDVGAHDLPAELVRDQVGHLVGSLASWMLSTGAEPIAAAAATSAEGPDQHVANALQLLEPGFLARIPLERHAVHLRAARERLHIALHQLRTGMATCR